MAAAPDRRAGTRGRPAHGRAGRAGSRAAAASRVGARSASRTPGQRPRQRDRPARGPLAAADRDRRRSRRHGGAGGHRQRGGHRRADRAGARARGPRHAQDARAGVARRLEPGRGGRDRAAGRAAGRRSWSTACWRCRTWPRRPGAGRSCRPGRPTSGAPGIGLQRTVAGLDPARARRRARLHRARSGSSPGCRSRSGSAPQGVLIEAGLRRGAHRRQRRAAPERQRTGRRRSTRTSSARSAARRCARSRALDRGPRPEHGPGQLRDRGQPGDAGLGALAARRARCCCRRWWRPWTPSPARAASAWRWWPGCAGSAPGWRPSWPASRSRELLALVGRHAAAAARAGAARRAAARRRRRSACSPAWRVAMALALLLARFLAARPGPEPGAPGGPGAAVARRAGGERRRRCCCGWPTRTPGCSRCRPPTCGCWCCVAARPAASGACARCCSALGALPALLVAVYYMVALSMDPLSARLVPAAAGDRAHRGAADGAGRLRDAGRAVRRRPSWSAARPPSRRPSRPRRAGARARSAPGFALRR